MTEEHHYTISKLAAAADVSLRTIRYYTAEGLLPPPQPQGRYATYTQAHLQRLRLIQRLKNAYLPLSTIRAQVSGLSDTEVNELLSKCPPVPHNSYADTTPIHVRAVEPHHDQSQLDYIAQILAVTGQKQEDNPEKLRKALLVSPLLGTLTEGSSDTLSSPSPLSQREVWERIPVAEGVELHVRVPNEAAEKDQMESLITQTKALFASDSAEQNP